MAGRGEAEIKKQNTTESNCDGKYSAMLAIPVQSPECACNTEITSEAQRVRETRGFTSEVMPINIILQKYSGEKEAVGDERFKKLAAQIQQGHHQSCSHTRTHTYTHTLHSSNSQHLLLFYEK